MTDDKQQAYHDKYSAELDGLESDLDRLKAKAAEASADARIEYEEQIEGLKQKIADQRRKLAEIQQAGEDAWDELSKGFEAAWSELASAWESAKAKLS